MRPQVRLHVCGTVAVALALAACTGPDPRFGEARLTAAAPRLTLSGTTFGESAALELAPGCPGYLDAEQPGHVITVEGDLAFTVRVRSDQGPLALAVASADEVRCDSDEGSGHTPTLSLRGEGEHQIFVAALRAPAALAYELVVATGDAPVDAAPVASGASRDVSVTITSEPAGAEVRAQDGRLLGRTPAMFVETVPVAELGQPRTWTLHLADHQDVTVTGTLAEGAMVLHGQLLTTAPTSLAVSSAEPTPIRDYQAASLAVEVAEQCAITDASVGVRLSHTFVGDLRILLRTPTNDELVLARHEGGGRRNLERTWTLADAALAPLAGRTTRGRWTLVVHDDAGGDQGSLERFDLRLGCGPAVAGATPTPTPNATPRPSPRPTPSTPTTPPDLRNPWARSPSTGVAELPQRGEIVRVLGGLRPRTEACATQGGQARVLATVQGSTGRVTSVSSSGTASASERACVERVVRTARFSPFGRPSVDVDYTYDLPARSLRVPPPAPQPGNVIPPWTP